MNSSSVKPARSNNVSGASQPRLRKQNPDAAKPPINTGAKDQVKKSVGTDGAQANVKTASPAAPTRGLDLKPAKQDVRSDRSDKGQSTPVMKRGFYKTENGNTYFYLPKNDQLTPVDVRALAGLLGSDDVLGLVKSDDGFEFIAVPAKVVAKPTGKLLTEQAQNLFKVSGAITRDVLSRNANNFENFSLKNSAKQPGPGVLDKFSGGPPTPNLQSANGARKIVSRPSAKLFAELDASAKSSNTAKLSAIGDKPPRGAPPPYSEFDEGAKKIVSRPSAKLFAELDASAKLSNMAKSSARDDRPPRGAPPPYSEFDEGAIKISSTADKKANAEKSPPSIKDNNININREENATKAEAPKNKETSGLIRNANNDIVFLKKNYLTVSDLKILVQFLGKDCILGLKKSENNELIFVSISAKNANDENFSEQVKSAKDIFYIDSEGGVNKKSLEESAKKIEKGSRFLAETESLKLKELRSSQVKIVNSRVSDNDDADVHPRFDEIMHRISLVHVRDYFNSRGPKGKHEIFVKNIKLDRDGRVGSITIYNKKIGERNIKISDFKSSWLNSLEGDKAKRFINVFDDYIEEKVSVTKAKLTKPTLKHGEAHEMMCALNALRSATAAVISRGKPHQFSATTFRRDVQSVRYLLHSEPAENDRKIDEFQKIYYSGKLHSLLMAASDSDFENYFAAAITESYKSISRIMWGKVSPKDYIKIVNCFGSVKNQAPTENEMAAAKLTINSVFKDYPFVSEFMHELSIFHKAVDYKCQDCDLSNLAAVEWTCLPLIAGLDVDKIAAENLLTIDIKDIDLVSYNKISGANPNAKINMTAALINRADIFFPGEKL